MRSILLAGSKPGVCRILDQRVQVFARLAEDSVGWLSGHVWGENIGWIKFKGMSPAYGVRSMAFYTQAQGTPNWWV